MNAWFMHGMGMPCSPTGIFLLLLLDVEYNFGVSLSNREVIIIIILSTEGVAHHDTPDYTEGSPLFVKVG
jgi:hypothetical protein